MAEIKPNAVGPVKLRKMMLSDMKGLMQLKNAEGWNQIEKDWALLINYQDSVNLVAVLDDRIIGTVTAINYANTVVWIGMMLVEREYRGRGISKLLLEEVIRKLERCESIKLDATPAGRPVYLKLGFIHEYRLYRMANPSVSKISPKNSFVETEEMNSADIPEVAQFDEKVFGADRTALILRTYENYPELAWLIRENNRVVGFCLGKRGLDFTQIGPAYASSEKGAKALIRSAINQLNKQAVVVYILSDKTETESWLTANGFTSQRPLDRMYLNHNPHPGIIEKQYLICGPELG